jgi:hypothetical protein
MKNILTVELALSLVGKCVRWGAPGYEANGNYGGVAQIVSVDTTARRPIKSVTIEGDSLDFAFVDQYKLEDVEYGLLCYSDGDRYVSYEAL